MDYIFNANKGTTVCVPEKILVIGGTGYIGSALYNKLKSEYNIPIDTVDLEWFGNYSNPENHKIDFDSLTAEFLENYDVIILVAAHSSVPMCTDVLEATKNNVHKVINLLNKLSPQPGERRKFIYASSSCVYTNSEVPVTEDGQTYPIDGLTLSKIMLDNLLNLTDIEYYALRFGSVNGWSPNMRPDLMINAMTLSALDKGEINVFNGQAYRPILSINDLCRAVTAIIDKLQPHSGVYNLAGFNSKIADIGCAIGQIMGVPINISTNENINTYNFLIDSNKFCQTFNFDFIDTEVQPIVESILLNPRNGDWQIRK